MRYLILLYCCLTTFFSFSNDHFHVDLTAENLGNSVGENIGYLVDSERVYNSVSSVKGVSFLKTDNAIPDFNFTNQRYWLKFDFTNQTQFTEFIFETGRPITNTVEFYLYNGDELEEYYCTGDEYSYYDKPIEHRKNLFPVAIDSGETKTIYLKFESDGELLFTPIIFHDHLGFFAQDFKDQFKNGFYYGVIALVVIIYFFFFIFLKDKSFLFYILYAFSQGLLQFSLDGFSHHHFFPNGGYITNHSLLIFAGFTVIFLLNYVAYFLKLKERHKPLWRTFLITRFIMGGIMIISLIPGWPYELSFPIINGASLLAVLMGAFSIVYLQVKGYKVDIFFSIAFIILIVGAVVFILGNLSIVGDKIISLGALKLSSALEFVILSVSMSNRYGRLQREKEAAQQLALQNLKEKNEVMDQLNIGLENQVKERTSQIEAQKEALAKSNQEIVSSIKYAERIQKAILPSDDQVNQLLPNSYIIYQPKDVVSGDFYFVESVKTTDQHEDSFTVFAAVDCTGHGVPGAFMSIVGHNLLTQSLKIPAVNSPGEALDYLNDGVGKTLRSSGKGFVVQDGMDIAMCALHVGMRKLLFAGARNPLYIIRQLSNYDEGILTENILESEKNDEAVLIEIKGKKKSIGNTIESDKGNYPTYSIELFPADQLVVFSDGFADQFGGPKRKKYSYKRFKELLLSIYGKPIAVQKEHIQEEFLKWKGPVDQTDDLLIISTVIQ